MAPNLHDPPQGVADLLFVVCQDLRRPIIGTSSRAFYLHNHRTIASRDLMIAEDIPYPPPLYISPVPLHAGILLPGTPDPSTSSSSSTTSTPSLTTSPSHAHLNFGFIIGAILLSVVIGLFLATSVCIIMKKKRIRVRVVLPKWFVRRSLRKGHRSNKGFEFVTPEEFGVKIDPGWADTSCEKPDVSLIDDESVDRLGEWTAPTTHETQANEEAKEKQDVASLSDSPKDPSLAFRRYSTPAGIKPIHSDNILDATRPKPMRPSSSPANQLPWRDVYEKEAQLRQLQYLNVIREPPRSVEPLPPQKEQCIIQGLNVIQEKCEVDITETALSTLHRYSFEFDSLAAKVLVPTLFLVDPAGKVVRAGTEQPPSLPTDAAVEAMLPESPPQPSMASSSTGSILDMEAVGAFELRTAHTRSIEIERGTLISFGTPSTSNTTLPSLFISSPPASPSPRLRPYSSIVATQPSSHSVISTGASVKTLAEFPSPPPMLSPIPSSATSLSREIEDCLEERVFAFHVQGPWSKENYKLTTPGQVRALAERLARPSDMTLSPPLSGSGYPL